jgi:hypothetical protein
MHPAMRFFRQFIGDASCGSPLAALIGVLMALQALIGGFGSGTMAFASVEEAIICTAHDADRGSPKAPGERHSKDCCLTACQIAASLQAGLPAKAPAPPVAAASRSASDSDIADASLAPRHLGLSSDARAPPVLPI